MNLDNSFSCYLISAMTLDILVLRKRRRFFNVANILSQRLLEQKLCKISQKSISYGLKITVGNGFVFNEWFFCFDTTRFHFFEHNCVFYEFISFPCQIITLLTRLIQRRFKTNFKTFKLNFFLKKGFFNCLIFAFTLVAM